MKRYPTRTWPSLIILLMMGLDGFIAQQSHAQLSSKYSAFAQYTVQNGLPSNKARALLQDHRGFIWVGTEQGLVRFNGYDFESIALLSSSEDPLVRIGELYEDTGKRIWVGGREGLAMYDPVFDETAHYIHDEADSSTLSHNNVFAITEAAHGQLWIGTERGLNLLESATGEVVRLYHDPFDSSSLCGDVVTSLVRDEENILWVGTEKGLCSYNEASKSFTRWEFSVESEASPLSRFVRTLQPGDGRSLWVGTQEGLFKFDIENKQFSREELPARNDGSSGFAIISLISNDSGTLVVGTETGEIYEKNVRSNQWRTVVLSERSTLQTGMLNSVRALLIDRLGVLWIGTWQDGIFKHVPLKEFQSYTYSSSAFKSGTLTHPEVNVVLPSKLIDNQIWIGTNGGGLNVLNKKTGKITEVRSTSKESFPRGSVLALEESEEGTLWVATNGALFYSEIRLNTPQQHYPFVHVEDERISPYIFSIAEDRFQQIWLGTSDRGVLMIKKDGEKVSLETLEEVNDRLSHYTIWPLLESQTPDKLWIGTYGAGINRVEVSSLAVDRAENLSSDSLFLDLKYVLNMHEDQKGTLWIGMLGQGLFEFNPTTGHVVNYTDEHNLSHNSVSCIQSDNRGHIWIGTYDGLSFLDKDSKEIYWFSEADGLPGNYFIENACAKDSEGKLYFGTKNGLLAFDPAEILIDKRPPEVVITALDLYSEPMKLDTSVVQKKTVRLNYDENYLTVHFSGLHFATPEENMYAYMLEGLERDWRTVDSNNRFANYPSLLPGSYTFRVRASNSDGVWSKKEASMIFIIAKPYWQTLWYRGLWVLGILAALLSLHRYRVHHLLKVVQTRQQISADLHDNMGGSLSSIALFLEGLARQFRSDPSQEYRINYHARTSRQLIDDLRDTVWVVNADYDSLPELVQRMHQLADHASTNIGVHFQALTAIPDIPLNMDLRRNLLFIFKEALHNAIRHAEATKIDIIVNYEKDQFSFGVLDNGIGFNPEVLHKGRGLKNFRKRAEAVKGTLEIDSRVGIGTKITLNVKLPKKTSVYS